MNESSEEPLNAIVQTTAARRGPGTAFGGFAEMGSGTDACTAASAALLVAPRRRRHSHRQQLGRREAEQQKDMLLTWWTPPAVHPGARRHRRQPCQVRCCVRVNSGGAREQWGWEP